MSERMRKFENKTEESCGFRKYGIQHPVSFFPISTNFYQSQSISTSHLLSRIKNNH